MLHFILRLPDTSATRHFGLGPELSGLFRTNFVVPKCLGVGMSCGRSVRHPILRTIDSVSVSSTSSFLETHIFSLTAGWYVTGKASYGFFAFSFASLDAKVVRPALTGLLTAVILSYSRSKNNACSTYAMDAISSLLAPSHNTAKSESKVTPIGVRLNARQENVKRASQHPKRPVTEYNDNDVTQTLCTKILLFIHLWSM